MDVPAAPAATAPRPSLPTPAADRLHGRWLLLSRTCWLAVAACSLGLFAVAIPVRFAQLRGVCLTAACPAGDFAGQLTPAGVRALAELGLPLPLYAAYAVGLDFVVGLGYSAVAALIFWRKSDDRLALFTALALLTFGTATFTEPLMALMLAHPTWAPPVAVLNFLGAASFGLFLFLFPDGRFVPRWTRWVALAWLAWQVPKYLSPSWDTNEVTGLPAWLNLVVWPGALGTAIYAQVYRYRRISTATQRQQTKWVVLGIATAFTTFLGASLALEAAASAPTSSGAVVALLVRATLSYLALLLIPLSIGVAVLRTHLFDVDLLINRALVYGVLSAGVIGLYVLVVGALGALFQSRGNLLITLLATGLVALLVQPLRERLQRGVNHLLYGQRDEPYAVLSRLGQRLETTLAPDAVLATIVETVAQTLKLPHAAISLRQGDALVPAASYGTPVGEPLALPLVYGAESVGQLALSPRAPGEAWTPADRRLLGDLAHQVGVAAHAVRLNAELRRAREQLVLAREEERRRLRRDLHDGLGPQLASQTLTLAAASKLLRHDPAGAEALLAAATAHAQAAVADIRRVVYALRPPALDDLGLVGVLREQAAQYRASGVAIAVEVPEPLPPLPAAVEVAAYRIAQEALTNVVRHAGARTCVVSLALDGALCLEVRDDGAGLPDPPIAGSGVGLRSMRERAQELGGTCVVGPAPGGGTLVRARLPLGGESADQGRDLTPDA